LEHIVPSFYSFTLEGQQASHLQLWAAIGYESIEQLILLASELLPVLSPS